MLKIVEIVIIRLKENVDNETAGIKGFSESGAHILCALFVGGYELCDTVFHICYNICNIFGVIAEKSVKSDVVFIKPDSGSYDIGRVFKAGTAAGTDNFSKNKTF